MKRISWLSFVVFLAIACQDDQLLQEEQSKSPDLLKSKTNLNSRLTETGVNCGEHLIFPLIANGLELGTVEVEVDESFIYVTYGLTSGGWFLLDVNAFAGDCNTIPETDFPYSQTFSADDNIRSFFFEIPHANLPDCGCIRALATVGRINPFNSQLESFESSTDTDYCNCDEPEEPDDENLRTQTPGGWGAPPSGDNPGAYLHANFGDAFPAGLVVGCDYTITLTSAQAVTNFLPQGGTPSSLTQDYLNPINSVKSANNPKNVLAGHVVALTLSVTFDGWDEDFGESSTNLDDAVVTEGDFAGWTVAQVLAEAEKVLGGCDSEYSASALTEVLSAINESFVDGTTDTGFLMNGN